MKLTAKQANAISAVQEILTDIAERAEQECEFAKQRGDKQGNYRAIAQQARRALRQLALASR